jgi:hypothetical protein
MSLNEMTDTINDFEEINIPSNFFGENMITYPQDLIQNALKNENHNAEIYKKTIDAEDDFVLYEETKTSAAVRFSVSFSSLREFSILISYLIKNVLSQSNQVKPDQAHLRFVMPKDAFEKREYKFSFSIGNWEKYYNKDEMKLREEFVGIYNKSYQEDGTKHKWFFLNDSVAFSDPDCTVQLPLAGCSWQTKLYTPKETISIHDIDSMRISRPNVKWSMVEKIENDICRYQDIRYKNQINEHLNDPIMFLIQEIKHILNKIATEENPTDAKDKTEILIKFIEDCYSKLDGNPLPFSYSDKGFLMYINEEIRVRLLREIDEVAIKETIDLRTKYERFEKELKNNLKSFAIMAHFGFSNMNVGILPYYWLYNERDNVENLLQSSKSPVISIINHARNIHKDSAVETKIEQIETGMVIRSTYFHKKINADYQINLAILENPNNFGLIHTMNDKDKEIYLNLLDHINEIEDYSSLIHNDLLPLLIMLGTLNSVYLFERHLNALNIQLQSRMAVWNRNANEFIKSLTSRESITHYNNTPDTISKYYDFINNHKQLKLKFDGNMEKKLNEYDNHLKNLLLDIQKATGEIQARIIDQTINEEVKNQILKLQSTIEYIVQTNTEIYKLRIDSIKPGVASDSQQNIDSTNILIDEPEEKGSSSKNINDDKKSCENGNIAITWNQNLPKKLHKNQKNLLQWHLHCLARKDILLLQTKTLFKPLLLHD